MTPVALAIARLPGGPPSQVTFLPAFWLLVPGALGLIGVATIVGDPCLGDRRRPRQADRLDRLRRPRRPLRRHVVPGVGRDARDDHAPLSAALHSALMSLSWALTLASCALTSSPSSSVPIAEA